MNNSLSNSLEEHQNLEDENFAPLQKQLEKLHQMEEEIHNLYLEIEIERIGARVIDFKRLAENRKNRDRVMNITLSRRLSHEIQSLKDKCGYYDYHEELVASYPPLIFSKEAIEEMEKEWKKTFMKNQKKFGHIIPRLEKLLHKQQQLEKCIDDLKNSPDLDEALKLPPNFQKHLLEQYVTFSQKHPLHPEEIIQKIRQELENIKNQPFANEPERKKTLNQFHKQELYQAENILHRLGYESEQGEGVPPFSYKKIWPKPLPIEIPIGVGSDPSRMESFTTKSIGLIRALFEAEREAEVYGGKGKIVIYDTPQITNYHHFTGLHSPHEYIENYRQKNCPEKNFNEAAQEVAEKIGKEDMAYIENIIQKYSLKHIEVQRFGEIEQTPFYKDLYTSIKEIIYGNKQLHDQLLNTVNSRFKHRAHIIDDPKANEKSPFNEIEKQQILEDLAEYGLKVVVLHIYNLGDTYVHEEERKNYKITQNLLKNKAYREKILGIIQKHHPDYTDDQLKHISFPHPESFQGISLDDNPAPEEYKLHKGKNEKEVLLEANQVLLSDNPLAWLNLILSDPAKKYYYLEKVITTLLAGHMYFSHRENPEEGQKKLEALLTGAESYLDIGEIIQKEIGAVIPAKTAPKSETDTSAP